MPNRILREGILTSKAVSTLGWAAEVLYRRLMSVADDYGRHFADPVLLRSHCYPRQVDKVHDADVMQWLSELVGAGLVIVYREGETNFLQLEKFGQQQRSKSKHPEPTCERLQSFASRCQQAIPDEHLFVFVSVVECVSVEDPPTPLTGGSLGPSGSTGPAAPTPPPAPPPPAPPPPAPPAPRKARSRATRDAEMSPAFLAFWSAWPAHHRKVARRQCWDKWQQRGLDAIADKVMAALAGCKESEAWRKSEGNFVPAPLVWLNQDRWEAPTEAETVAAAAAGSWTDTRSGIVTKAVELGMPAWDESAWAAGVVPAFPVYSRKVFLKAGLNPDGSKP